jgi:hypothetical protein
MIEDVDNIVGNGGHPHPQNSSQSFLTQWQLLIR